MPSVAKQKSLSPKLAATRLKEAIASHVAGEADAEGVTALDAIVSDFASNSKHKQAWQAAVVEVGRGIAPGMDSWWPALELFLALTELTPPGFAELLEEVL